jgi:hypothetical protein
MSRKKKEIVLTSRQKTLEEDDLAEYLQSIMHRIASASQGVFSGITWTPK